MQRQQQRLTLIEYCWLYVGFATKNSSRQCTRTNATMCEVLPCCLSRTHIHMDIQRSRSNAYDIWKLWIPLNSIGAWIFLSHFYVSLFFLSIMIFWMWFEGRRMRTTINIHTNAGRILNCAFCSHSLNTANYNVYVIFALPITYIYE